MPPASSPPASLRQQVETFSRPVLVRLHALPRPLVPVATVVLVAIGLLAPLPVALVALALVLVFVVWIGYLSWPAVTLPGRLMRLAMVALIVVMVVTRL